MPGQRRSRSAYNRMAPPPDKNAQRYVPERAPIWTIRRSGRSQAPSRRWVVGAFRGGHRPLRSGPCPSAPGRASPSGTSERVLCTSPGPSESSRTVRAASCWLSAQERWAEYRGYPGDRAKMLDQLTAIAPDLVELAWARTVSLDVWSPGNWWSTRVFWDEEDGTFLCYYIDFVRPFSIQGRCLDTLDLALDIVVSADGRWAFKDLDEYEDLRRTGWIGDDDHEAVERAKPDVIAAIDQAASLSTGASSSGNGPPGLPVGVLPDGWDR